MTTEEEPIITGPAVVLARLTQRQLETLALVAALCGQRWKSVVLRCYRTGDYPVQLRPAREELTVICGKLGRMDFAELHASTPRPYAYEMTLVFRDGRTERKKFVASTEARARRIGGAKTGVVDVRDLEPLTREEHDRVYGRGRM